MKTLQLLAPSHANYHVVLTFDDRYHAPSKVGGIVAIGIYRCDRSAETPRFRRAHSRHFDQETTANVRPEVWGNFEWGADGEVRAHVTLHDHDNDLATLTSVLNLAAAAVREFAQAQVRG